eukprot:2082541-Rhodomonas_salina.1
MYHKARHINNSVSHLQELCKDSVLVLEKVLSTKQVADSLTKSTPKQAFEQHHNTMLGVQTTTSMTSTTKQMGISKSDVMTDNVDEMEGIELGDKNYEEGVESGLYAFVVPKFKALQCTRDDDDSWPFLSSLKIRLMLICFIIILGLYSCVSQEYVDYLDFRLGIHYAQCMVWMCNAEFYDFHVFPPWERDIDQCDMQVEGA